jgi:hypothetical protein
MRINISILAVALFISLTLLGSFLYIKNRDQIIERNANCAHPVIDPSGQENCLQELVPQTLSERFFGMPVSPDCDQSATTTDCKVLTTIPQAPPPTGQPQFQDKELLRATEFAPHLSDEMKQIGKVDDHVTVDYILHPITFCGKDFHARRVLIDGIDFAQRLAELLPNTHKFPAETSTVGDGICSTIGNAWGAYANYRSIELPVLDAKPLTGQNGHTMYGTGINLYRFTVNLTDQSIYVIDGFDGTPTRIGPFRPDCDEEQSDLCASAQNPDISDVLARQAFVKTLTAISSDIDIKVFKTVPEINLKFSYNTGPNGYVLHESEVKPMEFDDRVKSYSLYRQQAYEELKKRILPGGLPVSIDILVYKKPPDFTHVTDWAHNRKLFDEDNGAFLPKTPVESASIAGASGIRYPINGMYNLDYVIVDRDKYVYLFSGPNKLVDTGGMADDFNDFLQSLTFLESR